MVDNFNYICEIFGIKTPLKSVEILHSGHINDTYLVSQQNDEQFVVQKLNSQVFKNAEAVIANKIVVSEHLQANYIWNNSSYQAVTYVKTNQNKFIYKQNHDFWNVMCYIPETLTLERTETTDLAFEAGKLYGDFIVNTQSIPPSQITETIKDFHSVPFRLIQFEAALKNAKSNRLEKAADLIVLVKKHKKGMCELANKQAKNHFPIRITHNDAKLSNLLFSTKRKGLAVIDLDTVMPGIVHYDFGDSIRSICTKSAEDETDLSQIHIDLNLYQAYCDGFASKTKSILTSEEITYLPLGVQTIIYIMGLRFLTDFLNNDSYYKTAYDLHNFDRARNQFKLLQSVFDNLNSIEKITRAQFT